MEPPNFDIMSKLFAGAWGSAIAAWMARATGFDLLVMFIGGSGAAWFVGGGLADHFGLVKLQSVIGFAVGFVAIFIMSKLREVILAIEPKEVIGVLTGFFRRGDKKGD